MPLRPSRVLQKLRAGQVASCVKLNLADPRAAEIAALCGVDCVWLDREHVPGDLSHVENQVRAAKMHNVDSVVRVPRGSYSDLVHPLEMDAAGIMVPHVMGLEDARRIVYQTRFHPIGRRPLDGGNADGAYCTVPVREYMTHANRQRFVIVQIEDPEPMEDLDAIAQLDGIDILFFGPGDFSQGIGAPGDFDHPKLLEARRRIAQAARRYGKFAGTVASCATLPAIVAMGYQFVSVGADVVALAETFRRVAEAFASLSSQSPRVEPVQPSSVYQASGEPTPT